MQTMSSKKNVISVFCSIFNGMNFLPYYLRGITSQTIFSECELILIDAGSEDCTKIINEYKSMYSNIFYTKITKDPGIYGCWNMAVKMASGKFLNNANLDDIKKENALEEQVNFLERNQNIDLVYSDSLITNIPNLSFDECLEKSPYVYNFPEFSPEALIDCNPPHQSPVYRKTLHDRYGYFDTQYRLCADAEFWLRCAAQGAQMKKINQVLGGYYFNPTGISTNKTTEIIKMKEEAFVRQKYSHLGTIHNGNAKRIIKNPYFKK